MKVIQITKAGSGAPNVWVEAGIHAREWIASGNNKLLHIHFFHTGYPRWIEYILKEGLLAKYFKNCHIFGIGKCTCFFSSFFFHFVLLFCS